MIECYFHFVGELGSHVVLLKTPLPHIVQLGGKFFLKTGPTGREYVEDQPRILPFSVLNPRPEE